MTPRPRPNLSLSSSSTGTRSSQNQHGSLKTLVISHGISIQGSIQDAERLVVEGTVEANIIKAKEFVIAHGGIFRGTVEAETAEVAGTIDGELKAFGSLTVHSTGRLIGKAACHRLQVEDGGQITGQLEMITSTQEPASPLRKKLPENQTPESK
ncbi:polymer-forming cytoskeletal protein [Aristophania vespae]|uniref:Polymer-forming cytoskeletal protein n=1 Tax=Aristophania vespae TaxID=2697033 RepID=A0A6P1NL21_9PROT|nr:polymer-forming cytoskeletal protein [Aristophania vespae]